VVVVLVAALLETAVPVPVAAGAGGEPAPVQVTPVTGAPAEVRGGVPAAPIEAEPVSPPPAVSLPEPGRVEMDVAASPTAAGVTPVAVSAAPEGAAGDAALSGRWDAPVADNEATGAADAAPSEALTVPSTVPSSPEPGDGGAELDGVTPESDVPAVSPSSKPYASSTTSTAPPPTVPSSSSSTSSTSTTSTSTTVPPTSTSTSTSVPAAPAGPARVSVEVLDQSTVERLGGEVLAFRVQRADGVATELPVGLRVSYGPFRFAYGAGWDTRVRLVALPACVLTSPEMPACWTETVIPTRNDLATQELVVDAVAVAPAGIDDLAVPTAPQTPTAETPTDTSTATVPGDEPTGEPAPAGDGSGPEPAAAVGGGVVFVLSSSGSGATGDFSATPLAPSSSWNVGLNSGNFAWSYEVPVQPAIAGGSPQVRLDYSSQSIDGMTSNTNSQPGWVGLGWSLPEAYIERSYRPCSADGGASQDLCWYTDPAGNRDHLTISLDGVSGRIVSDGSGGWKLAGDASWRVEHRAGASHGFGGGEYWVVKATDGTQYWFGFDRTAGTGNAQGSAWAVPVQGNHAGEPAWG
jgi:hypothetical protein